MPAPISPNVYAPLARSNESLTEASEADTVVTPSAATSAVPTANSVDSTLAERGSRYGKFSSHARITQRLKNEMRVTNGWQKLSGSQAEALDMIAHKIGRILNGDPNYADSWHDIAGYAQLVDNQLNGKDI